MRIKYQYRPHRTIMWIEEDNTYKCLNQSLEHSWCSVLAIFVIYVHVVSLLDWIKFLEGKVRFCSFLYTLKCIIYHLYIEGTQYLLNPVMYLSYYLWTTLLECAELEIYSGKNIYFALNNERQLGLIKYFALVLSSVWFYIPDLCTQPMTSFSPFS